MGHASDATANFGPPPAWVGMVEQAARHHLGGMTAGGSGPVGAEGPEFTPAERRQRAIESYRNRHRIEGVQAVWVALAESGVQPRQERWTEEVRKDPAKPFKITRSKRRRAAQLAAVERVGPAYYVICAEVAWWDSYDTRHVREAEVAVFNDGSISTDVRGGRRQKLTETYGTSLPQPSTVLEKMEELADRHGVRVDWVPPSVGADAEDPEPG